MLWTRFGKQSTVRKLRFESKQQFQVGEGRPGGVPQFFVGGGSRMQGIIWLFFGGARSWCLSEGTNKMREGQISGGNVITQRAKTLVTRFSGKGIAHLTQICYSATILIVALLVCSLPAIAQVDTAQINGTVRDQNGAVVPNAKIQVRNLNTGFLRETVTNSTGTYVITQIPPGTYSITAGAAGFASQMRSGVALSISQNTSFDFALKPGAITEMVTVTASGVTVDTSSTSVGATLETKAVNDLPLAGRNYTGLLLLQTGVTPINNDQTGG